MAYIVELRYLDGNLADLMIGMRLWLDHEGIETERFDCCAGCPGLAFRIAFGNKEHAARFAASFGGCLQGADPRGTGLHWTRARSACETDDMSRYSPDFGGFAADDRTLERIGQPSREYAGELI